MGPQSPRIASSVNATRTPKPPWRRPVARPAGGGAARADRLESQVRSGTYSPDSVGSPSRSSADAEVDARLLRYAPSLRRAPRIPPHDQPRARHRKHESIRAALDAEIAVAREERVLIREMDADGLNQRASQAGRLQPEDRRLGGAWPCRWAAPAPELGLAATRSRSRR